MSNRLEILETASVHLLELEQTLIHQRQDIRQFIESKHTVEENLKMTQNVRESEDKIDVVLLSILDNREIEIEFLAESRDLCDKCRKLNEYTRDMFKALADDLTERRREEDKNKVDVISSASLIFSGTGLFMLALNYGIGKNRLNFPEAASAGIAVSSTVVFRKRIVQIIRGAARIHKLPSALKAEITNQIKSQKALEYKVGMLMSAETAKSATARTYNSAKRGIKRLSARNDGPKQ